jgi:phage terminase large subunit-like protein
MTNLNENPLTPRSSGRKITKRSESAGDQAIRWIEDNCRIPEGKDVGRKVELRPWQKKEIRRIYDNPAGTRRAIISFGRKNAKTTLAAFLLLLHLCGPRARPNSQLYSAAQSRQQASVIFDLAAKMVRLSPTLRDVVGIRESAKQLFVAERGTVYRALSAEVSTSYGLSPVFIVHDELGQVKGPRSELYDALETATGAQENPLSVIISTQAPTDADLLSDLIDKGLAEHDPRVIVSLYTAPIEADPFSEETIKLANPAYGDFLNAEEVKMMAQDARLSPARESSYRNLVLNQRVEAKSPFVSRSLWESCGREPLPLDGAAVFGGLDLSETQDLTALVLVGNVNNVWQIHPTFWLPEHGLREKAKQDRVPYDVWERQGYLKTAPGKSVDYEFVARHLRRLFGEHMISKIAFDRWNFKHLVPWLLKAGFNQAEIDDRFVEFGQGYQSMSPALRDLEVEILNGRIAHGNHPVLKMCAANAVVQSDPAGNRKLAKDQSSGRIDGMVALTMAMGAATQTNISIEGMIG